MTDDLKDRYESFMKNEQARVNILGIEGQESLDFFRQLEMPTKLMNNQQIDACISMLCKRAHEHLPQYYKQRIYIVDTSFYLILLGLRKNIQPSPTRRHSSRVKR
ncbi:PREDICTED: uncharacterized protein LOC108662295 [Theobroma cacao]|uniref:Uncharacterized protein LOC108662295 n=1 Tax=Theobroma cacao TaxID=3641 RepID=A0AB32WHV3_THECC|nr:PREDICTED: uncharacterized protein LOC108662295 [Theobroma cacao]